ncbi:MAG: alpha-glucan family phosphorylase, partial [Rhodopirellula sp.]|nr:alpha-glucan family phosphorylase [Rhodopirellula sp.]
MSIGRTVAYFSMEIGVHPEVRTYSGGLGMLAGDTIRSAASASVPMVAVSLLYRQGYFSQHLDETGWQTQEPTHWVVEDFLAEEPQTRAEVIIEGRTVHLRAWRFDVQNAAGFTVPVYFLDSDLPENSDWDRLLTQSLYGGDSHYRLCQEVILGIGGVRMLRALGHSTIERFHMNEGHAALLTIELLREVREWFGRDYIQAEDLDDVRRRCVFTTHTPVPAGHDQFELDLVDRVLGNHEACGIHDPICHEGRLNMTYLALSLSHYINGVAKRHGEVSRHMFAGYKIDSITNGVHAGTWVCPDFAALFDRHISGWQQDNFSLRYALSLSNDDVWSAHQAAKHEMIEFANSETHVGLEENVLTLGFARRAAAYKRADLIFDDVERLKRISRDVGRIQIVFAGKAHPRDEGGKQLIQRIIQTGRSLAPDLKVVYLQNYDMKIAKLLTAGVDVWLNTPEPPLEASGTSGMKAALNGVPSLSILDGWWIEGCIENIT